MDTKRSIHDWKPWAHSTGPRSAAGKARAALNAYRHGRTSRLARLHQAMRKAQAAYKGGAGSLDAWRAAYDAWAGERRRVLGIRQG